MPLKCVRMQCVTPVRRMPSAKCVRKGKYLLVFFCFVFHVWVDVVMLAGISSHLSSSKDTTLVIAGGMGASQHLGRLLPSPDIADLVKGMGVTSQLVSGLGREALGGRGSHRCQ